MFTGFYRVSLGFSRALGEGSSLGFTGFYWVLSRLYKVSLGFTEFYWVLLGSTGF